MNRWFKWIGTLLVAGLIVAVAAGVMAFSFTSKASASSTFQPLALGSSGFHHRGGPDFPGTPGAGQEALANALGITVEQLQTAQQQASDAAIQQAVDQGLITQEQADNMILRGSGFGFGHGFEGRGAFGQASGIDYNALLAQALGISVEQLQAAQQQAESALLDQAVANGTLTQEQADLIRARQALQSYIDPNAIFAQALGITTDQLQAYRDQGLTLSQILSQAGKTAVEVRNAEQAAYQTALQQAVTDGVITQAQADQIQASGFRGIGGIGCGPEARFGGHGRRGFDGFGRFGGQPGSQTVPPITTPSTTPSTTGVRL